MSSWDSSLAFALPALLITMIGIFLRSIARDPKIPRGDAILADLGLGLVMVAASVLWLRAFVSVVY